jgi:hypothetical protein
MSKVFPDLDTQQRNMATLFMDVCDVVDTVIDFDDVWPLFGYVDRNQAFAVLEITCGKEEDLLYTIGKDSNGRVCVTLSGPGVLEFACLGHTDESFVFRQTMISMNCKMFDLIDTCTHIKKGDESKTEVDIWDEIIF